MKQENDQPVRSMTGYARVRRTTALGELTVSLRTVNHRSLDVHFHQSQDFYLFENAVRALLKQHVARGHAEVRISLSRTQASSAVEYNRDLVNRYVTAARQLALDFGLKEEISLEAILRMPGVWGSDAAPAEIDQSFQPEVLGAVADCAAELNRFREREGAELRELLRSEARAIRTQTAQMRAIRSDAVPELQKRLQERLETLLGGSVFGDARRLVEETAILVDRSDVQEELSRLEIHTDQLFELLRNGGELGKKLDFLLQEMNRETNTILSKTSGIGETGVTMSDLALATKANIEKIREQALNLE